MYDGVPFPLVVSLAQPSVSANLAEAARAHKDWVEARLYESGAILFRGFDVATAYHFNDVVDGFGYEAFPLISIAAPRTHVVGPIYTASDSPPAHYLDFHNENAYLENHPRKGFLYCEVEPRGQGETPIVLGHIVYERMMMKHSDFLHRLEKHGCLYHRILSNDDDALSPSDKSWKTVFTTDDKTIAEHKAAEIGWKLKWLENGAKFTMRPVPGIKIDDTRPIPRKVWFNAMMATLSSYVDPRYKVENPFTLGDGSPIPPEVVEECRAILEDDCVAIPWKHGDVLLIDNHLVQHARRPYTPPRRVLVVFTN